MNVYLPQYGPLNSDRIEAAHQLDIRVDRKWQFKHWSLAVFADITNVYFHPRVLRYTYNFDYSERDTITELPLVPAFGWRGSF